MIVDDRVAILGSANVNDRSMDGDRDSELGVVFEEQDRGEVWRLRVRLWGQHFGMGGDWAAEVDGVLWQRVRARCEKNTILYRVIFGCYPDDSIHTVS